VRILVADDDPVSLRLLEATIRRLGHEVVAVRDGASAASLLLDPDGPRLAILDWMMPETDGLAVCRAIRKRPQPYVYVILLTARDSREDMVEALDAEADDFLTKPFDVVELRARLRSGQRVLALQEGLLAAQDALRHEATHDRLTGLWNRGMILDQLDREVRRSRRAGSPVAVVIADIDHFKDINDRHGHAMGDAVLRQVAERMRAGLRDYDTIGRYGGEEFLLVFPGCTRDAARDIAERVRATIARQPVAEGDVQVPVTVSFGVACTRADGHEPTALIRAADEALYRAKHSGRNLVEV
jgi:diguanylate cyclase (GGDEF)-like protein